MTGLGCYGKLSLRIRNPLASPRPRQRHSSQITAKPELPEVVLGPTWRAFKKLIRNMLRPCKPFRRIFPRCGRLLPFCCVRDNPVYQSAILDVLRSPQPHSFHSFTISSMNLLQFAQGQHSGAPSRAR